MPVNATEAFVFDVCSKSFLTMWSYVNPQGRTPGRELCDILVVCDPDVVIVSVKEVRIKDGLADHLRYQRWVRRAVDDSVAQVYGAERWIDSDRHSHVVDRRGVQGVAFPNPDRRRIHRVAVALGGDDDFPLPFGDFGKGFVHVLNRRSFEAVVRELDTITDFVAYLSAKERLFNSEKNVIVMGEENLLAIYLHNNRQFPGDFDTLIVEDGLWAQFLEKREVIARDREDEASYVWDNLIELIAADVLGGHVEYRSDLTDGEILLRTMARESRFSRRMLGDALSEFLHLAANKRVISRMVRSHLGVGYVFMVADPDDDVDMRNKELGLRCFVARGKIGCEVVVGLATERPGLLRGFSWSLVYLNHPNWSEH